MAGTIARMHRPVASRIGRRLGAATTPDDVRRLIERTSALMAPCTGVRSVPARFGSLGGLVVTPKAGSPDDRAMLMFHGGGYVFGSAKMYRGLAGRIAKAAGIAVYVPDYRLAPEDPHPAAFDDGLEAYRAMLDRVGGDRLVVVGDSAGGGLTLAVVQAARNAGLPLPAGMVLMSPWLDLRGDAAALPNAATETMIVPEAVERAKRWYRGDRPADDPAVSPLLGRMEDLPPTLVQVASNELLFHEAKAFVDKARAAGVDVTLEAEDDLWHVWQLMAPTLPEARASIASIGTFTTIRTT